MTQTSELNDAQVHLYVPFTVTPSGLLYYSVFIAGLYYMVTMCCGMTFKAVKNYAQLYIKRRTMAKLPIQPTVPKSGTAQPTVPKHNANPLGASMLGALLGGKTEGPINEDYFTKYEKENNVKLLKIVNKKVKRSALESMIAPDNSEGHISMKTADRFINEFRNIPDDKEVHILIHTNGGELNAAEIICRIIHQHKGKVVAIVPNYAYSAGTMISLACDEILTSNVSVFGPIDPQMGFPSNSIIEAVKRNCKFAIEDVFRIESEKAINDVKALLTDILTFDMSNETRSKEELVEIIMNDMVDGKHLHGHPIFASKLSEYKLTVNVDNDKMKELAEKLELDK
jgi:hypothetical protein